jgi:hypothetical protein
MREWRCALALLLALPVLGAELKTDFSNSTVNEMPAGFQSALAGGGQPGDWKIIMDELPSAFAPLTPQASNTPAMTQHAVLAQLSRDPTDERFPMLIYDKETFDDFKLTTQFKIVSGVAEQMAGIVFRCQNSSNFYVIRASALGRNIRFYKVVNGLRGNLLGPEMDIATNVWHTLAVQCQGNQFMFWLDGRLVMPPLNDNTFADGKIGFWTKSDAVSYFGDTTISYTPRVPMAQTLVDGMMRKYPRILKLRIYTLASDGNPQIIASNDQREIGQPGGDAEKGAIKSGTVYFGRGKSFVAVTMPLDDRNGDPVAAVRVESKSFFGETQDIAVDHSRDIVKQMQKQVVFGQDLTQ